MAKPRNLIYSAPGKIILFGEWDVLDGGPALSIAVAPRFNLKIEPCDLPRLRLQNLSQFGPTLPLDLTKDFFNQEALPPHEKFWFPLLNTIRFFYKSLPEFKFFLESQSPGWDLSFHCEWPLEHGLGSSSALVACWLAFFRNQHWIPSIHKSFEIGKEALRSFQSGLGSGLDLATQLWGRSVEMNQNQPHPGRLKKLPTNLYFLRTGKKKLTAASLKKEKPPTHALQNLRFTTQNFLNKIDFEGNVSDTQWIESINNAYLSFEGLPLIHTPEVLNCRRLLFDNHLIEAFKTTGAGGGDCLLLWVPSEKQKEFVRFVNAHELGNIYSGKFFTEGAKSHEF